MAQGLCETFYQSNTFRLLDHQLPEFLNSGQHRHAHMSGGNSRDNSGQIVRSRRFEVTEWIMKLIVRVMLCTIVNKKDFPTEQLRKLLGCPRLTNLVLDIESDPESPLDFSKEKALVLTDLKTKLGSGLKIYCDMGWSYGNPAASSSWRRDVSGMFLKQIGGADTKSRRFQH